MITTGPRNLITDVPGVAVGNAENHRARTGVSVILPEHRAIAAVDVRGGAPGTREADVLNPDCLVDAVDAIVLSGGSVFGLDAAGAVVARLAHEHRGFQVGDVRVPIVPSAILFDLLNGGDKAWGEEPPYRELARQAMLATGTRFELGNIGAGYGATAGHLKGGLGSASLCYRGTAGYTVGALAAVNAFGSAVMPDGPLLWAWPFERDGELGGQQRLLHAVSRANTLDFDYQPHHGLGANTTLCVVATDAPLDKTQARRIAIMAQDGLARALRPVHTPFDGDTVFVLSVTASKLTTPVDEVARIGMLAADCVTRAIARGVFEAASLGEWRAYRDVFADSLTPNPTEKQR